MDPAALHATVRSVAGRILGGMGLDLRGRLRDRDGTVILELGGPDARILLQEDGDAIVALQHILNRIVSRDEKFESRIVVDCAGFRVQRDQQVIDRAMRSAEEALRTGSPVQLEGLNAYERRLAHMALSENGAVRTYSTGEGAVRQLTIEPVRGRESSKEP
jgi:spoIIIJ-associated protein